MSLAEYKSDRELIMRVGYDLDLIQAITEIAKNKGIKVGTFTVIGALKHAKLGYYDQKNHEYREMKIDLPHEIASCIGNISLKDAEPFIHAHAVLADENGNTKAGHLFEGIVFAAEVHLRELEGPKLERKYDELTGLSLMEKSGLPNPLNLDEKTLSSVVSKIKKGNKVEAVKIVHEASNRGLRVSEDYVDELWEIIWSGRS